MARARRMKDAPRSGFGILFWLKIVLGILVLALAFGAGFGAGRAWEAGSEVKLDVTAIEAQIADCSDLTTAELTYNGFVKYENGKIPFLSKKAFSMSYTAQVRAGVNLGKATVNVSEDGRTIDVELPAAEIQSTSIDPKSIEFYDRQFALLNWDTKQDAVKAMSAAKDDVAEHVDTTSLMDTASENAKTVVEGLLLPFADAGYAVQVKQTPASVTTAE